MARTSKSTLPESNQSKVEFYQERSKKTDSYKIAAKTGYSQSHVCNVLAGRRTNTDIANVAYRMVKTRKGR
jgi:hypothetical protein